MAYDNTVPSYADIRALSIVYLRAIALAWTDDEVGRKFRSRLIENAEATLQEYFNYKCPFLIKLEVRETPPDAHAEWRPAKHVDGQMIPGHWTGLLPNVLDFNLPLKPEPLHDEAIALAAYVDGGPGYLFTCC